MQQSYQGRIAIFILKLENISRGLIKLAEQNRKEHRVPTKLVVKIHSGVLRTWGVVSDISHNGLFIHAKHKLNPDTILDIELMMPDGKTAVLRGVVKRIVILPDTHRKFGMGVEVIEKDTTYRDYMKWLYQEKNISDHTHTH